MSERRGPRLGKVLEVLARTYGKEPSRNPGDTPLDHVVYGIIAGNSPMQKARAAFEKLKESFVDWNELRVAEAREIVAHLDRLGEREDLYARAVAIVRRDQKASTSYLQRRLLVGYNRAADLMERMEREGIVSAAGYNGRRQVLAN